jgi:hypothetical protein
MKRIVLALLCVAVAAFADDPPQTLPAEDPPREAAPAPQPKGLAELVEASKAAKAAREKKGGKKRKVITNADVKKSKGKLDTYVPKELPAGTEVTVVTTSMLEQHERNRRALKAAEERHAIAEKRVSELQKDLNALELSFYEENDPNYRDGVIQQRFAQTKRQLEESRTELANARDALNALAQPAGPQAEVIEAQAPPQP